MRHVKELLRANHYNSLKSYHSKMFNTLIIYRDVGLNKFYTSTNCDSTTLITWTDTTRHYQTRTLNCEVQGC